MSIKKDQTQKEVDLEEVIATIIYYRNDREFMDEVSKTTFPFTSKYLDYKKNKPEYYE